MYVSDIKREIIRAKSLLILDNSEPVSGSVHIVVVVPNGVEDA